eukprot:Lithocolla_globosa_v1_NODE_2849_length_1849_cov_4.616499.p1 type:complete len:341 gc:universal NODE_2849_length_1849_cov_4.616499:1616-594(-)
MTSIQYGLACGSGSVLLAEKGMEFVDLDLGKIYLQSSIYAARSSNYALTKPTSPFTTSSTSSTPNPMLISAWHLTVRALKDGLRSIGIYATRLVASIFIALVIASVYYGSTFDVTGIIARIAVIFIQGAAVSFLAIMYIPDYIDSHVFYKHELNMRVYRSFPPFLSQMVTDIPFCIVTTFIWATIVYAVVPFRMELENMAFTWLILFLTGQCGVALVHISTVITSSAQIAMALFPVTNLLFILFCGFFLRPSDIPSYWIWAYYISYLRYGLSALLLNELAYNEDYPWRIILDQFGLMEGGIGSGGPIPSEPLNKYWFAGGLAIVLIGIRLINFIIYVLMR